MENDDLSIGYEFLKTPIGEGVVDKLFDREFLARALIMVLLENKLINYHDVLKALNRILAHHFTLLHQEYFSLDTDFPGLFHTEPLDKEPHLEK